jgi:hypothetical protein
MSFSSDLDTCLSNGGFPTLGQIFTSLTDALSEISEVEDALANAGIDITTVTLADLQAAAKTLTLSAEAAALLARIIAIAATVTISVYLGALATCAARVAVERHLQDELAAAPDSSAKRAVQKAMHHVRPHRVAAGS